MYNAKSPLNMCVCVNKSHFYLGVQDFNNPEMEAAILKM